MVIGVGVVGLGNIGKRHVEKIQANPNFRLLAVCDIESRAFQRVGEGEARRCSALSEMLQMKDVELVSVCTPNHLHFSMSVDALNQGKHVLCEKPMALSVHECQHMIDASLRMNRKLFIVKQNRFNPPVVAVKRLILEGALGVIQQIVVNCYWNRNDKYYAGSDWKGKLKKDGGALYTQFSHFVDLMYWFAGEVATIYAYTNNYVHPSIEIDDAGVVHLSFASGAVGSINYTNNAYLENMEGSITIFAEKGTVKIGGKYLNELEYQRVEGITIEGLEESEGPNNYHGYQGSMSNHHRVYESVANSLLHGESSFVSGIEGMKTVEIIELAYRSAASGTIMKR